MASRDFSPADWIMTDPEIAGGSIVDRVDVPSPAGANCWLLYLTAADALGQLLTVKDGQRLFCVKASGPRDQYALLEPELTTIIRSFTLLRPECRLFAEEMRWLELQLDAPWRFSQPVGMVEMKAGLAGWSNQHTRYVLCNPGTDGKWAGDVTVDTIDDDGLSASRHVADRVGQLGQRGISSAGAVVLPLGSPPRFRDGAYTRVRGVMGNSPVECTVLALQRPGLLVRIAGVSFAREHDPLSWLVIRRSVEILFQSLTPKGHP